MKFNWKVTLALVLIVASIVLAVNSIRSLSYSGKNLTFAVGSGPVSITNSSDASIPVQFVGAGSRSFVVQSTTNDVTGSSTREGSGSTATQVFGFDLPIGGSEFTITRGTGVNFVANTDTRLVAVVQPASATQSNTTTIAVVIFIMIALYYISRTTEHQWMTLFRGSDKVLSNAMPDRTINLGQGNDMKSFGDNRK